jgi:hypothetical protein
VAVSLIKWLVIAILVAGTFGVVWTAPWKDDVEVLTEDVSRRVDEVVSAVGLRADDGSCDALRRPPSAAATEGIVFLAERLRDDPDAVLFSESRPTVREWAESEADEIAGCFAEVSDRAPGWDALKRRLDAALAAA